MTVITKDEASALQEAGVFKRLRGGGIDGKVYGRSGPGPVSTFPAMQGMVDRGWFVGSDGGWEITSAGEAAAKDLNDGTIGHL